MTKSRAALGTGWAVGLAAVMVKVVGGPPAFSEVGKVALRVSASFWVLPW